MNSMCYNVAHHVVNCNKNFLCLRLPFCPGGGVMFSACLGAVLVCYQTCEHNVLSSRVTKGQRSWWVNLSGAYGLISAELMGLIQSSPVQSSPVQFNPIQSNPVQFSKVHSSPVQ